MGVRTDIVILNYNTKGLLEALLPLVKANTNLDGVQIVVADNASSDGSAEYVKQYHPDIELVEMKENRGYAGGYNACLKGRTADYFVLLNSDAEPAPGWLPPLIDQAENHPECAAVQPALLDFYNREKYEYAGAAGGFLDHYGYPFCRGRIFGNLENVEGQYSEPEEIFWASGAALFMRRTAWEQAGGLDETFFAHMEEIDLCWRLKNKGWEIWACPDSTVYHMGGATLSNQSPRKTYLNFRNGLLMLYKNLHEKELNRVIFRRKLLDGLAAVFFMLQGKFNHIPQIWKAHRHFDKMKRNFSRPASNKPMSELTGVLKGSLVFRYFLKGQKTTTQLKHMITKG
ncbi:MAG: glycosyltransferase family 2 protein [Bacteroidetes bacterium]|nr:glycosyltransferase family 2 protein [Bacteroidota bacterium]